MRLLWLSFLVFPTAVVCSDEDDLVELLRHPTSQYRKDERTFTRNLRYEEHYDLLASELKKAGGDKIFNKILQTYLDIPKALVPHSSHPTPEELQQLTDKVFTNGRIFYEDYRRENETAMITQLVYNFSTNTAILRSECPGESQPECECKMAHALETAGSSPEKDYLRSKALEYRCYFERWMKHPKENFAHDMMYSMTGRRRDDSRIGKDLWLCYDNSRIITGYPWRVISFEADEVIEFAQSRKNLEAFIKTFNIFMEAVKNPKSYESIGSFTEKINRDRILKAATQIISEFRRCAIEVNPEFMKRSDKVFISCFNVSKIVLANDEDPTLDMVQDAIDEALLRRREAEAYIENNPLEGSMVKDPKFRKCFLPESAIEQVRQWKPVFDGNRADEDKHLLKVANISKTLESVVQISYEYLHHLRNRVEWTDETRNFFTKVLRSIYELAGTDGTTEEGKETQEKVLNELRESFIELSHDAKKMFADHFLYGSVILLSCIF